MPTGTDSQEIAEKLTRLDELFGLPEGHPDEPEYRVLLDDLEKLEDEEWTKAEAQRA